MARQIDCLRAPHLSVVLLRRNPRKAVFLGFISPYLGVKSIHGLHLKSRLLSTFRAIPGAIDTTGGHRLHLIGLGISDSSRIANIEAQSNKGCSNPGTKRRG
jgi:hypothetical protein